jgi:hypothetical protein
VRERTQNANKRMSMTKKIFTPEVLASIPQMVADGLRAEQIAALIGTTPTSLKVRCSQHKISLGKRGGPKGPRGPYGLRDKTLKAFATRLANIQLKIKVDAKTLSLIAMRAEKKGTTVDAVASRVLEIVARDNLYDAVIDDAGLA